MLRLVTETDHNEDTAGSEIINTDSIKMILQKHVWGLGIATSIGFSILSFILTLLIVCCYRFKVKKGILINIIFSLVSLSIGSLFGDAVIHIMPEIFNPESHDHGEEEHGEMIEEELPNSTVTSALIVTGFLVFFIIEKIFILGKCHHSHGNEFEEENSHDNHNSFHLNNQGKNIL
jgi:hypothetical protein